MRLSRTSIRPTVDGMAAEGREYRGILYAGLMLTDDGPKVLEFNCRLGDPETQSVLRRLDGDLAAVFRDAADGRLEPGCMKWTTQVGACVVLAADGYPAAVPASVTRSPVSPRLTRCREWSVFHAGTRLEGDRLLTAGGRVLSVTALGDDPRRSRRSRLPRGRQDPFRRGPLPIGYRRRHS